MFIYDSTRKLAVNLNTLTSLNVRSSRAYNVIEIHLPNHKYVYPMPTEADCTKLFWEIINAYESGDPKVIEITTVAPEI